MAQRLTTLAPAVEVVKRRVEAATRGVHSTRPPGRLSAPAAVYAKQLRPVYLEATGWPAGIYPVKLSIAAPATQTAKRT